MHVGKLCFTVVGRKTAGEDNWKPLADLQCVAIYHPCWAFYNLLCGLSWMVPNKTQNCQNAPDAIADCKPVAPSKLSEG